MIEEQEFFTKKLEQSINYLAQAKSLNIKFIKWEWLSNGALDIECLMDQEFSDKVIKVSLRFEVFTSLFGDVYFDILDRASGIEWQEVKNNRLSRALARVLWIIKYTYKAIQENNEPIKSILERRPSLRVDISTRGSVYYRDNYVEL